MTRWPAALLFDMDGTLIESHANVDRAWATWATMHGLDPEPLGLRQRAAVVQPQRAQQRRRRV